MKVFLFFCSSFGWGSIMIIPFEGLILTLYGILRPLLRKDCKKIFQVIEATLRHMLSLEKRTSTLLLGTLFAIILFKHMLNVVECSWVSFCFLEDFSPLNFYSGTFLIVEWEDETSWHQFWNAAKNVHLMNEWKFSCSLFVWRHLPKLTFSKVSWHQSETLKDDNYHDHDPQVVKRNDLSLIL